MFKSAVLFALASVASARWCTNITVPVALSSRNANFDLELPTTEVAVTDFFLEFARQNTNYTDAITTGVSFLNPAVVQS